MNLGYSGGNDEFDDSGVLSHVVITGAGQSRGYYDDALGQHWMCSRMDWHFCQWVRGQLIDTVQVDETSNGGASVHLRVGLTAFGTDSSRLHHAVDGFVAIRAICSTSLLTSEISYLGSAIRIR